MRILLITPPLTQLNTPYPATAALKGFLSAHSHTVRQVDLGIEVADRVLSAPFLREVGLESQAASIEVVKRFLRGEDDTLGPRIANRTLLPEGKRFAQMGDMEWAFGVSGTTDKAQHMATLFIEEIADHIREQVDAHFDLVRYAESLAGASPATFDELHAELQQPPSRIDTLMLNLLQAEVSAFEPDWVGFSVPFPGCLYGALRCGAWLKDSGATKAKVVMGGGFVNTELRQLSDVRLFDYVDYITLDDGELPLLRLIEGQPPLRTFVRNAVGQVEYLTCDVPHPSPDAPAYDFSDLPLGKYLSLTEMANPMHRLWSQGRWNKMMMAHGCYWHRCAFCDTSLDYIGRYAPPKATTVVDHMERIMQQTGRSGFHFVDEALPPALLGQVAEEVLRRGLTVSFWGNIRFEKAYTADLCDLLAEAGMVAASGGLEVASDRLLKLMDKGVSIQQTLDACRHLTEAGIMVHTYLMYGFPTESLQETVGALETVRRMFDEGLVQSAFWHRYAMTCHSPSGLHPERYGARRPDTAPNPFCNNEVEWEPIGGGPLFDYDIEAVGSALRLATYNYMNGLGLDQPAHRWFGQFPTLRAKLKPRKH